MCASFLRWYKALYVGRKWYVKTMAFVSTLVVLFFLYLGAVDVNLFWLFGRSPGWKDISEHKTNEASELYSADGVLLGKYFNQNRTPVKYEDVNPVFWKALIDTEDERYYDHWGTPLDSSVRQRMLSQAREDVELPPSLSNSPRICSVYVQNTVPVSWEKSPVSRFSS